MFVVDLDNDDIVWLAWAAGIATGSGNAGAQKSLGGILGRIQVVEDSGAQLDDPELEQSWEDMRDELDIPQQGAEIIDFPPAPEPAQSPPERPQTDFGAGPPPAAL